MSKDELLSEIKNTLEKSKVTKLAAIAGKSKDSIKDLIDLCFYPDKVIAFRFSWILENVFFQWQGNFLDCLDYFLSRYPEQNNQSCRRHFSKIMMTIADFKIVHPEVDWMPIVEATFAWLIDSKTPVAVRVNCLDVLYALRDEDDWIIEELKTQTQFLMKNGSAAMQVRGRKILSNLESNKERHFDDRRNLPKER